MLSNAICCVPVAALRKHPAHEAEMTSQLLFGEVVQVLEILGSYWIRVQTVADGYGGWCQQNHVVMAATAIDAPALLTMDWVSPVMYNGSLMQVPFGSRLTGFENGRGTWGDDAIVFTGDTWNPAEAVKDEATIVKLAQVFLNTAYLWGGRSVFGVDCSGFTQMVYQFLGIALPRDTRQQVLKGSPIDFLQQARCGDLAFFEDEEGRIIHVGLLLNAQYVIHAAGKVRIDKMDNAGIVHAQTGAHTHCLRIIKRYW